MTISVDLYPHVEASQVIAIDNNFSHRLGHLTLISTSPFRVAYMPDNTSEPALTEDEKRNLNKILYGWGKGKRYRDYFGELPEEKAEVKLGSNSKLKNCQDKALIHLVPLNVIQEVAIVYTSNFAQYGEDWKGLPNAKDIFYDAMMRHLIAWHSGEKVDPDDGKLHIIKVVGNAIFLAWHELKGA